jgi:hypothetical protein
MPIPHEDEYILLLKENDRLAKLKEVTIRNVPKDSMLISLQSVDFGEKLKNVINPNYGVFKCCDYLLISGISDKIILVFIELKSKTTENVDIKKQLKGATCFFRYCDSIVNCFINPDSTLVTQEHRYVLFSARNINKTTRRKNQHLHINPDSFYHHGLGNKSHETVHFDALL